jgi:tetratricopeptide (TPR) repeat protein
VKVLATEQIADRLGRSLDLLTGGGRDRPERQRTLRATLEWSYNLLSDDEEKLFARLAVFIGGCTLEAAQQVADADLDVLQSLVDKNLLRYRDRRFSMLETIRELAVDKLELLEDAEDLRHAHAQYLLELLGSQTWRADAAFYVRGKGESGNLRTAVEWALRKGHADLALGLPSLAGRTGPTGEITAHEQARCFDASLLLGERADPTIYATALVQAARVQFLLGNFDRAENLAQCSLDKFLALGDSVGQSRALERMGLAASARGDPDRARERLERGVELAEAARATTEHYWSLYGLGEAERRAGNLVRAAALVEEAVKRARDAADPQAAAGFEHGLGDIALASGDTTAASRHYMHALSLSRELGHLRFVSACLAGLASVAAKRGERDCAGRLWGASEAFGRASGLEFVAFERPLYEEAIATIAGPEFDEAVNTTQDAEPDQALAAALAGAT